MFDKISGGLLTPFIELQKQKKDEKNPYTTRESYLATIIHEFGHMYYDYNKPRHFYSKEENLTFLKVAQRLYHGEEVNIGELNPRIPPTKFGSELFAFCTEYYTAQIFWPRYKQNMDNYHASRISSLTKKENKIDLDKDYSVLEKEPHDFAAVIGKVFLTAYPKNWPQKILSF